jgi:hypothetical protein
MQWVNYVETADRSRAWVAGDIMLLLSELLILLLLALWDIIAKRRQPVPPMATVCACTQQRCAAVLSQS